MKLGMSSATFYGYMETEDAAGNLRNFDLDTCEVFLETFSEYSADFGRTVRQRLGGLPCASIHAKGTQFEPDIFGQSPRQHRDAVHVFEQACTAGEALGATKYVFHGAGNIRAVRRPAALYRVCENMIELQHVAQAHGLELLWENVCWCALRDMDDVRSVRELLPWQGFVLDLKQARCVGVDPFDMLHAMGSALRHVHVLDWNEKNELVLPGEGIMDFPRFFRELSAMDYDGAVILEPYAAQGRDPERLKASLRYLRAAWTEAGQ